MTFDVPGSGKFFSHHAPHSKIIFSKYPVLDIIASNFRFRFGLCGPYPPYAPADSDSNIGSFTILQLLLTTMRNLTMTVFTEVDGILRCTIQNLFECIPFYYQRRSVFLSFFKSCMSDPDSSTSIIKLLFDFR